MKKKVLAGALAVMLVASSTVLAGSTQRNIQVDANLMEVNVNGTSVKADNFLYNGTTYLPVRAVTEAMGAQVDFDQKTMTATITSSSSNEKKVATSAQIYYDVAELSSLTNTLTSYASYVIFVDDKLEYDVLSTMLKGKISDWKDAVEELKKDISYYEGKDTYYKTSLSKAENLAKQISDLKTDVEKLPGLVENYYKNDSDSNASALSDVIDTLSTKSDDIQNTANAQFDYYMAQITE